MGSRLGEPVLLYDLVFVYGMPERLSKKCASSGLGFVIFQTDPLPNNGLP